MANELPEWVKQIVREQSEMHSGLDEGIKEEMAQSFGVTVRQIEDFCEREGLRP